MYVHVYTGLCTICSFFLKRGAIDRGAMGTGAIGQGADVREACVHGGICPGAIVLGGGGGGRLSRGQLAGCHQRVV